MPEHTVAEAVTHEGWDAAKWRKAAGAIPDDCCWALECLRVKCLSIAHYLDQADGKVQCPNV